MSVIVGGVWTALGLASPGALLAGPRAASLLAPIQETEKPEPTRSILDGVYTEEQAKRGQRIYQAQCAECHDPSQFKQGYPTAYAIFSSGSGMPQTSPGSLSLQEWVDLIAYIFEANDMPSGKEELKGDPEILKRIRIEPEKPSLH